MSANIYWEPVGRKRNFLKASAPQAMMTIFDEVFGSKTPTLKESDIPILRAMAAAVSDENFETDYKSLADAIEKYGEIEIRAEY